MDDATPSPPLPPRIWVVGPCGSGKSTVAARLAAALGIAPTHLDEIHWRPGWIEAPPAEEAAALAEVVARPAWVVDGNYGRLRGPHLDAVDLFVWLDLRLATTLPRLLRRCLVRALRREPCCNGNYESLRMTFLSKDSLLLWALTTDARRRRQLTRQLRRRPHVRLRSQAAIEAWLRRGAGAGAPRPAIASGS